MTNKPMQQLVDEHSYIMVVVRFVEAVRQGWMDDQPLDDHLLRQIIAFMREFADHYHHAKEEDVLFPAMVEAGVPEAGCPIGGLKGEHTKGRHLVSLLETGVGLRATEPDRAEVIIREALDGLVKLYPDHVWKEDEMVFPMVERVFDDQRLAALQAAFARVDQGFDDSPHHHMAFARELQRRLEAGGRSRRAASP